MTFDPLALYEGTAAQADRVITAIRPDQLDAPSNCPPLDVRGLINHLVAGNMRFLATITGTPAPDADATQGDDPAAAFRDTTTALGAAFAEPGVLAKQYQSPMGEVPGPVLVGMRCVEMQTHAWDLARSTGQSTADFDDELAEATFAFIRRAPALPRGEGAPFGEEVTVPEGASAADRLAAYLGRAVA